MYYKEFLRVRNHFVGFAIAVAVVTLLTLVFIPLHNSHINVTSDATGYALASEHSQSGHMGDSDNYFPFSAIFAVAGFVAAIFASVLGCCLASENSGHLEIAWTRPVSRLAYAARIMLVDAGGILAIFAFTVLACIIHGVAWRHDMPFDADAWPTLGRFILDAMAWFALVAGLTASVSNRAGAIAGFSWVAALVIGIMGHFHIAPVIDVLVRLLNFINPIVYLSFTVDTGGAGQAVAFTGPVAAIGLAAMIVLGIGAALWQWQRLEA